MRLPTALSLIPPSEIHLSQHVKVIDPDAICQARELLIKKLAQAHQDKLSTLYQDLYDCDEYVVNQEQVGRRRRPV